MPVARRRSAALLRADSPRRGAVVHRECAGRIGGLRTASDMANHDYLIHDDEFRRCIRLSANVERLADGCRWAEGPTYFPALSCLVWSDIPNERLLRWDECNGQVGVFRQPSGYANGGTVDRQGRMIRCEQGGRRVTRVEHDGSVSVLADRYGDRRFNSPNDVVVQSNGAIWFSDPSYGIDSNYEGVRAEREQDGCHVYRIAPEDGSVERVADDFTQPNGLAFSPDETRLYIVDSGLGVGVLRVFDVGADGRLSNGREFARCADAIYDGVRVDEDGRVWISAGEGLHCHRADGRLIGEIRIPERVSNLVFGGPKRNRLFVTATTSLYSVLLAVSGAKTF
ncbi:SMP-30/Gluconolaconase/LRE-like region family protein [Lysobacter antibioticus]|nr:SMP-30/Gluconolaconase/LRE-like region family protein [Lysobacter antibioticus]